MPNTQVDNSEDERTDANTIFLEENKTNILEKRDDNLLVLIDKKSSSLIEYIEKRFHILEDQVIGMQNINLPRNAVNSATSENGLYADLLKNWISELKNQLTEKNAVISYLTTQLVTKSRYTSVNQNSRNIGHKKEPQTRKINNFNDDTVETCNKKSNNVVIIADSRLNDINGKGLSKSRKVDVLNIPRHTSGDIVDKIDDILKGKQESLIVHVGRNNLTYNVNLLSNIKKIVNKVKNTSPDTTLRFSNIIRREKRNLEKMRTDTNYRLKNFCNQKNIQLILKDNIKEEHLGIKKLHLNK